MKTRFLMVILLSVLAGCSGNPLLSSPEGKAVDAYLKENLNDPKSFELVEWFPPSESTRGRDKFLRFWRTVDVLAKEKLDESVSEFERLKASDDANKTAEMERAVSVAEQARREIDEADEQIKLVESGKVVFCRLKYRARNQANALTLYDQDFSVMDGKAKLRDAD